MSNLKPGFPLYGLGLVGDDDRGDYIIKECKDLGIDASRIQKAPNTATSYTDVMTVKGTGKRTFFHQRGANAMLDMAHFDFSSSTAKVFHLGYLLLLDKLDLVETDGETRAAKVLKSAKENGLITSADIVSEKSDRFKELIPSSLKYIDYLFVNEFEAGMISGIQTVDDKGEILLNYCYKAAAELIRMGVNKWVILHFPSGVIAVDHQGDALFQASIDLPEGKIEGAVGAGDAFAAGVLMGVHHNQAMGSCLELGVCAAASSLFAATSSDGITSSAECLRLKQLYGFRK
jgi:sugar/nucleoside kinase (ribokinase family)